MTTFKDSQIARVLGEKSFNRISSAKILIVGAGGIGCELLKNVVLTGFKNVHIIDLDTIDLSNLNRQFLFQARHIKRSKSEVAKETASKFNPDVDIVAYHDNIKAPQYDISWFSQFDIVLGALDNLDARRHVNKMCLASNTPLIESGTTGYSGNVQVIIKDKFECYDCQVKPTPKTFPVCTIRSTPSAPIHTIVWSKSYLLPQVFGQAEEDDSELDKAADEGENADEINTLKEEQHAFKKVRQAVRTEGGAKVLFDKIFNSDVKRLLEMEDMWKNRQQPRPLEFDDCVDSLDFVTDGGTVDSAIVDQRKMTLGDNVKLFMDATERLSVRARETDDPIEFDKDDRDTLDFVSAASNLRSIVYSITPKTVFEVKEMAGNIIPAIATTNAIIAGVQLLKAVNVLNDEMDLCKPAVYLGSQLIAAPFEPPNPFCTACRDTYISLPVDESKLTLGEFITTLRKLFEVYEDDRELSVFEKERLLYDPDFEDNINKPLKDLGCQSNTFITVVDEDGEFDNVAVVLTPLPKDASESCILPSQDSFKQPGKRVKKPEPVEPEPEPVSRKRAREEEYTETADGVVCIDDSEDEAPPAKANNATITLDDSEDEVEIVPPSKKTRLD